MKNPPFFFFKAKVIRNVTNALSSIRFYRLLFITLKYILKIANFIKVVIWFYLITFNSL